MDSELVSAGRAGAAHWLHDSTAARSAFERADGSGGREPGNFFLSRLFGFEFDYRDDACTISFELFDFMLNPQGNLHGGVIALVLDTAMGHCLKRHAGPGATLQMNTNYLMAANAGRLTCRGTFIRRGKTIATLRADLVHHRGDLIASATSTWKMVE
jgi:uncharacterized protein (TIGR00369 family)